MSGLSYLFAGGLAGMTTDIILHPLDTLKTRLQSRRLADPTLNFRSIYRGLFSQMMGTFPCNASFWIIYEGIKQELGGSVYLGGWKGLVPGVASALAECSVCTIRNPFDVVKLQLQAGMHKNSSDALRHILKADGFRGLYAGYRATLLRDLPFVALQLSVFEFLKDTTRQWKGSEVLTLFDTIPLAAMAGAVAGSFTTPLDVIKTRLMTQTGEKDKYKGWLDAFKRVLREEGPLKLFSGVRTRTLWLTLGAVIYLGSYEEYKKLLGAPSPKML